VSLELPGKERPDLPPAPAVGVYKVRIERQVSVIEGAEIEVVRFFAVDGQVKDGEVEERDERAVAGYEGEGLSRGGKVFLWGAEEQVDVRTDPCGR
jgi:hypothetical protein